MEKDINLDMRQSHPQEVYSNQVKYTIRYVQIAVVFCIAMSVTLINLNLGKNRAG